MSYHSTDVMSYVYDGAVYCPDCVGSESEVDSDEGWSAVFADEFFANMEGNCCGTCGHNLACVHKISGPIWENCPGCK